MAQSYVSAMDGTEAVENAIRDRVPLPRYAYHPREVAQVLGVSESYVHLLIARGDIVAIQLGKGRKVTDQDLKAYVEKLRGEAITAQEHAESGAGQ